MERKTIELIFDIFPKGDISCQSNESLLHQNQKSNELIYQELIGCERLKFGTLTKKDGNIILCEHPTDVLRFESLINRVLCTIYKTFLKNLLKVKTEITSKFTRDSKTLESSSNNYHCKKIYPMFPSKLIILTDFEQMDKLDGFEIYGNLEVFLKNNCDVLLSGSIKMVYENDYYSISKIMLYLNCLINQMEEKQEEDKGQKKVE